LFPDPDLLTLGRYVRCPAGQPHYSGFHNLGSRDWTSAERHPWPALGEYEGERSWFAGTPPPQFPLAISIGSERCLQFGEIEAPPFDRTFVDGFDRRCYGFELPTVPPFIPLIDVTQRRYQSLLANIQELLYTDAAAAALLLQLLLGPDSVVSFVADSPTDPLSGSLVGISPTQQVVMSSGTTNQQQWTAQLLYGGLGLTSYGMYSTNAQWHNNAIALIARMNAAGIDPTKPLIITGHSYGGATAQVVAAELMIFHPAAPVQLLTFGSPRAGDSRLYALVAELTQVHVAAEGDPLTAIPPVGAELYPFFLFAPAPLYAQWAQVSKPRSVLLLAADGSLRTGDPALVSYANVYNAVFAAIGLDPLPVYASHLMSYYADKIKPLP